MSEEQVSLFSRLMRRVSAGFRQHEGSQVIDSDATESLRDVKTPRVSWAEELKTTAEIPGMFEPDGTHTGKIKFTAHDSMELTVLNADYMIVLDDSVDGVEYIAKNMAQTWGLRTPKLVLTIIASDSHFKPWKRMADIDDFMDGLMTAASLTDMWILTEGRNSGASVMIGNAVARERNRRRILDAENTLMRFLSPEYLPRLRVMGVVPLAKLTTEMTEMLNLGVHKKAPVCIPFTSRGEDTPTQLNPNMTHFFVISDSMGPAAITNFLFRLENRLMRPVGKERRYISTGESEAKATDTLTTPLIGLLIEGGPEEIDRVVALLSKRVPIIVICGYGKAADLLAFAYKAALETMDTANYVDYIKTELLRRLTEVFPEEFKENPQARNQCRDRILQCVAYATQGENSLLTLVNRHSPDSELRDLSKVILTAVLASQSDLGTTLEREQIHWNMQLCIDWKRPDLALSEIFSKYNLSKFVMAEDHFQQVLIRPGREEFVELFLERGFILHKYLNHRRLELLFERCHNKAFFVGICMEIILGEKASAECPIPKHFVDSRDCGLNKLLQVLTGLKKLVDPLQLSLNVGNDRTEAPFMAEQRALHALLYWAALTDNTKLCKILWSRTWEPMAMALVLSTFYSRLAKHWISDHDQKLKVKNTGIEFGKLAVKLLDLNYKESHVQALRSLTAKLADFRGFTAVDLALVGKNKYFIAHPCCQRYVTDKWYGSIRIRDWSFGLFSLPDNIKIFLCLIFIFPIYFWIDVAHENWQTENRRKRKAAPLKDPHGLQLCLPKDPLLIQKLYYLWTAPITKFWVAQIFYVVFLLLFAYGLSQPFCGDSFVHWVVTSWLGVIFLDQLYMTIHKKLHSRELPVRGNVRTMVVTLYSLFTMLVFRVFHYTFLSFTTVKVMLSFSLIFFCYYAMGFFFPVSQRLGPMLVNITVMIRQDLIRWVRMWFLTLVSGAVTMHAVLYPASPFGLASLGSTALRGIFTLFMTDVSDLGGEECSCLYDYAANFSCNVSEIPETVRNRLETCPYSSPGGYFIVLQYIFHTKLVYNTLIFAICSVTMSRTYIEVVEIWKYQFFLLVLSFVRRPALPVPLVVLMYPWILISSTYHLMLRFCLSCCPCCPRSEKPLKGSGYNMWKAFVKIHQKQEQQKLDKLDTDRYREQRLQVLAKEQATQAKQIETLHDRLVEVLNSQTSVFLMMENMQHVLQEIATKKKTKAGAAVAPRMHQNCRKSPYPGTSIRRFAVFDKNVPWEENYPTYDPPLHSRPLEEYEEEVRPYVDPDLFEVRKQREEREKLDIEVLEGMEVLPEFSPEYNTVVEGITVYGDRFTVDRTSWMTKDDQPVQYSMDITGAPRNPMGRTGIRGRGNLWRWGPNHKIYAIVSRWRSVYNSAGVVQGPMLVNGKRVMEVLVTHNEMLKEDSLPGGFVSGRTSMYSVICEVFMRDLLGEKDVPGSVTLDQEDMTQFFRQFVSSDFILSGLFGRSIAASSSFSSSLIYRGYMDDSNNTDNAWVEAEVWNFHYHSKDKFDKKIGQGEKHWREVSELMQLASGQLFYVLEVARMFDDSG